VLVAGEKRIKMAVVRGLQQASGRVRMRIPAIADSDSILMADTIPR
jgi:hypothetical protein